MNTTTRRQRSDTTRRSWAHRHRPALLFALISGAVLALLFLTRGDNVMAQDDKREEFLAAHIWEHRVVLVLGDDEEDSTFYTKQLEAFDALTDVRKGWQQRHLVLYACASSDDKGRVRDHTQEADAARSLSVEECKAVRERVAHDLRARQRQSRAGVILIGKDGGTKLAQTTVLSSTELFELIDSMPMRQSEMRQQER